MSPDLYLDIGEEEEISPPRNVKVAEASPHLLDLRHLDQEKRKKPLNARANSSGRVTMLTIATLCVLGVNLISAYSHAKEEGQYVMAEAKTALNLFTEQDFAGAEEILKNLELNSFLLQIDSDFLGQPSLLDESGNLMDAFLLASEMGQKFQTLETDLSALTKESSGSKTELLNELIEDQLEPLLEDLRTLESLLQDSAVPDADLQKMLEEGRSVLQNLIPLVQVIVDQKDALLTALGDGEPQQYLLLLQNDAELRPWGGFPGSFASFTLNDGELENLEFWDVYKLDNRFFEPVEIPAPEMVAILGAPDWWRFRDAGVSPDFAISAEYAIWLYEMEGGGTVDGVIAINADAASGLFKAVFGSDSVISLPSLPQGVPVNEWMPILSTLVEAKVFGTKNPKAILEELMQAFFEALKTPEAQKAVIFALLEEVQNKSISVYHTNPQIQALLDDLSLSHRLPDLTELRTNQEDYSLMVETSMGGNKAGAYIERVIDYDTVILEDGTIVDRLTVTFTHTGTEEDLDVLKQSTSVFGFTDWTPALEHVMLADYSMALRVYLPEGAKIMDLKGIPEGQWQSMIDADLKVPYFYSLLEVAQGQSLTIEIEYSLPWNLKGQYPEYQSHLFQQLGSEANVTRSIDAPDWSVLDRFPESEVEDPDLDYVWAGPWRDTNWALLFQR